MEAKEAIRRAIEFRDSVVLVPTPSTRVEEVEQKGFGWHIVLSWLERDFAAESAEDEEHPVFRIGLAPRRRGVKMERVYRLFVVRDDEPLPTMSTVEWAR